MILDVKSIAGLDGVPNTCRGVRDWLQRRHVPTRQDGKRFVFSLLDIPDDVQLSYRLRLAEEAGLAFGEQDDAAHIALAGKPLGVQETAHLRAKVLGIVHKCRVAGLTWHQIAPQIKAAGLDEARSQQTIKRWLKLVEGLDPANWAPALAPDYVGRTVFAPMSEAAWDEFLALIAAWGRNGTGASLHEAWAQVADKKAANAWEWPPYRTVLRRFKSLPVEQQRTLTMGADEAAKSITHRLPRSVDGMKAMEQVELDGREFKVKVTFDDGTVACPWVIVYADRASCKIVGWAISNSENEDAAAEATNRMCDTYGIPSRVVTDNGGAFNGRRMAGGLNPLIRRKDTKRADWDVPGLFKIYGIELKNCAPRKGWAKLVESVYSKLRHVDNDAVFHGAQRSGPNDAPNPNPAPVPMALFKRVIEQRIERFNSDCTSRAMGLKAGESRNDAFARLSDGGAARAVSPLQRRMARMKFAAVTVQNDGRIKFAGGIWGHETAQTAMLHHAGTKVLAGFDPQDYSAPAVTIGWEHQKLKGRTLIEGLPCFEPAKHNDEASRRRAVAEERRAKAVAKKYTRTDLDEKVAGWRADAMAGEGQTLPPFAPKVVQLAAGGPFSPAGPIYKPNEPSQAAKIAALLKAEEAGRSRAVSGGNH
jgi:Bacteriophage Mu transposase